jgi:hypothetical protein
VAISTDLLLKHHNIGFKLISLSEKNTEVEAWTPVYDNPNYWTPDKIIQESYKFKNVAICFGKTHLRDAEVQAIYYIIIPYCKKGSRQNIVLGLSGLFYKDGALQRGELFL